MFDQQTFVGLNRKRTLLKFINDLLNFSPPPSHDCHINNTKSAGSIALPLLMTMVIWHGWPYISGHDVWEEVEREAFV